MSYSNDTPRRHDPGDRRAARNTARLLAAGLVMAVLGAVVAFSVYSVRRDGGSGDPAPPGSDALPGVATEDGVGPQPGADLGAYLEASRRSVAAGGTGDRVAVVSMKRYRTDADARRVVADLPVVTLLVALPGRPPAATSDVARWIDDQKAADRAERDEIRKLIPTVDDPSFKQFYTEEVARLDKAIASTPTDVVFGVVVRAAPPRLQALAASPDVRMVDVARADPGSEASYRGIRPEETTIAGDPATRPL